MTRSLLTLFAGLLLGAASFQAVAVSLPVETLSGKKLEVPAALPAGPVVLVAGFNHSVREGLSEWEKRIAAAGITAPVYRVAVIEGMPSFVRGMALGKMRKGQTLQQQEHALLVSERGAEWKQWAGATDDTQPYVLLLDTSRNIVWRAQGAVNDAGLAALKAALAKL